MHNSSAMKKISREKLYDSVTQVASNFDVINESLFLRGEINRPPKSHTLLFN